MKSEEQGPFHLSSLLFLGLLFDFPCYIGLACILTSRLDDWLSDVNVDVDVDITACWRVSVSVCQCVSIIKGCQCVSVSASTSIFSVSAST